jgi:hypothetical protein
MLNLATYFRIQIRILPLLGIFFFFYLLVLEFVYLHTDLVFWPDGIISDHDCARLNVDHNITKVLLYFMCSASLTLVSVIFGSNLNKVFFAKKINDANINFLNILKVYINFYLIYSFILLLMLAFINKNKFENLVMPLHFILLAILPIYLIYKAKKDVDNQSG